MMEPKIYGTGCDGMLGWLGPGVVNIYTVGVIQGACVISLHTFPEFKVFFIINYNNVKYFLFHWTLLLNFNIQKLAIRLAIIANYFVFCD